MEQTEIKTRIADLRQRYLRLALSCKAAGIRVNSTTVNEYAKELQNLQTQLN